MLILVAGSLSQLHAFHPTVDRGGHLDECMRMADRGNTGLRFRLRCVWHRRGRIDEEVRMR